MKKSSLVIIEIAILFLVAHTGYAVTDNYFDTICFKLEISSNKTVYQVGETIVLTFKIEAMRDSAGITWDTFGFHVLWDGPLVLFTKHDTEVTNSNGFYMMTGGLFPCRIRKILKKGESLVASYSSKDLFFPISPYFKGKYELWLESPRWCSGKDDYSKIKINRSNKISIEIIR